MDLAFDKNAILAISRPHPNLLRYYLLGSLLWGPLLPIPLIIGILRYRTLHYQFNDEGITMRWGGFTRHEVSLAYNRIQDIHLRSNLLERRLGLARIEIQTAGGGGHPEMTLEGLPAFEAVRAFLYAHAQRSDQSGASAIPSLHLKSSSNADTPDLAATLREATTELRHIRQLLEAERRNTTEPG